MFSYLTKQAQYIKSRLDGNTLENLLWFIDIGPKMVGFDLKRKKVFVWFWVVHLFLLAYVYCLGTFVYLWKRADSAQDSVKSFFNVAIVLLVGNASWWTLSKRSLLKHAIQKTEVCDRLALHSPFFQQKHAQYIRHVKIVMFLFYGLNVSNGFLIYFPHRISLSNDFAMAQCVGMEPLSESPNGEICLVTLAMQEFTFLFIVLNYQSVQLILIEHASIMFRLLALEMNTLNEPADVEVSKKLAKEILPSIIKRHALLLDVINTLKLLYSVTMGFNFGSNAVCILLFFYIPLQEWLQFMPVLVYCFFVFFLYCFLCQRLVDSSEIFETAVYCCGWEKFDLREKKMVFVMLRQSQKPVILKAADIVPVNIATFASTLQAMFKFVTVVKI
ncbi:odorant receptor 30a-like [Trichoplusia ni]|uniref:Odorant receptor n=1 Tax=Trichoplusia ni TaxID=7111 RepID=A0A7E5X4Z2_TRINI|nr:odorant receptor 30a-like [Trichoplusia ni]